MATAIKQLIARNKRKVETVKLTILVAGVTIGIVRDLTTTSHNMMYELHQDKYMQVEEVYHVDTPMEIAHIATSLS